MDILFRKLTEDDIPSCLLILHENYPDERWERIFEKDISDVMNKMYPSEFLVVIHNEIIIGLGCYLQQTSCAYCLTWVNIIPSHKGKGIGRKLVRELERRIKQDNSQWYYITLETDKPIFYQKIGYRAVYKNGDKDVMAKSL